jgi:hypothetical protein
MFLHARSRPSWRSRNAIGGGSVLIVSHKATIRLVVGALLGVELRGYRDRLDMSPCGLSILDVKSDAEARLVLFNDVSHYATLPGPDRQAAVTVVGVSLPARHALDFQFGLELELPVDEVDRAVEAHDERDDRLFFADHSEVHGNSDAPSGWRGRDRQPRAVRQGELDPGDANLERIMMALPEKIGGKRHAVTALSQGEQVDVHRKTSVHGHPRSIGPAGFHFGDRDGCREKGFFGIVRRGQ